MSPREPASGSGPLYEVAVAAPLDRCLTYATVAGRTEPVPAGVRVLVPLGSRLATGYVLGRAKGDDTDSITIRPMVEVLDSEPLFPQNLIPFFRWIAGYYHYPLGEVIRTALPGGLVASSGRRIVLTDRGRKVLSERREREEWLAELLETGELDPSRAGRVWRTGSGRRLLLQWEKEGLLAMEQVVIRPRVKSRLQVVVRPAVSPAGQDLEEWLAAHPDLSKPERRTLELLFSLCRKNNRPQVPRPELTRRYRGAGRAIRSLAERGLVVLAEERIYRDPFGNQPPFFPPPERLTSQQNQVLAELVPAVKAGKFQTFLLHGVTGCGKTEVYMQAAEQALSSGRGVLVLVPEIALASQIEAHFYSRFGDQLAVLHSGLGSGERFDQWQRILQGRARIVIGARSAVFAPLRDPGLIIVDEEHEPAYKQDDGLRYNGRDLAILRAKFGPCPVVLGSATPAVTSYHHARKGRYRLLTMDKRVGGQCMPAVEIVDLAREKRSRPDLFFSDRLISALHETMEKRQQSLLFVNRRGYSSFMLCNSCGHIVQCRHCHVSLTLHRGRNLLVCHYCGYTVSRDIICPACSGRVVGLGLGAERVEEEVRQLLPHARVARLDSDTTTSRRDYLAVLREVREGRVDILIGTQMIAKGLHFPDITLVGVIWADSGLGMPDYKASERTFDLLAQVTGRAGRGDQPGRVIIQTHQPGHYAISSACSHDYLRLYEEEIRLRRRFGYPPFSRLVNCRFSGPKEHLVEQAARGTAEFFRRHAAGMSVTVSGPAPAPLARLRDRYRWQLLLQSEQPAMLHRLIDLFLDNRSSLVPAAIRLGIDVDPENMM